VGGVTAKGSGGGGTIFTVLEENAQQKAQFVWGGEWGGRVGGDRAGVWRGSVGAGGRWEGGEEKKGGCGGGRFGAGDYWAGGVGGAGGGVRREVVCGSVLSVGGTWF